MNMTCTLGRPRRNQSMTPRRRKFLNPRSDDFGVRFGIHLRELLDKRKLTVGEFSERVQAAGVNVSAEAVHKWIAGGRIPRPQDMEGIAAALGLKDYRHLLPPPQ